MKVIWGKYMIWYDIIHVGVYDMIWYISVFKILWACVKGT